MRIHNLQHCGLHLAWGITEEGDVRLLHVSAVPFHPEHLPTEEKALRLYRLAELAVAGCNQTDHHGNKYSGTAPGIGLTYVTHRETITARGRLLEIVTESKELELTVTSCFRFASGLPVAQVWTEIHNKGGTAQGLEYAASFALSGLGKEGLGSWERKLKLHVPHSAWYGECQWKSGTLEELGLSRVNRYSVKRLAYTSTGTWSSSQYVPMGYLENTETGAGLVWQIEHNGSWHWEVADMYDDVYLQLSGPTENESHWFRKLKPGETFKTVPAAVGAAFGFEAAMAAMTGYRRQLRRPNRDNEELPVIFNDYMNCLFGDPTTDKLLPLIDAAAETGCEIFCVDCGWYSSGPWWDGVGEWLPSGERFPGGIEEVMGYIRSKGMVPGLWLELEVMGIHCPLAERVPDDWFFLRHGRRVIDRSRFQLDYRNPEVRRHAESIIDRLVAQYGVGYIKMDYNINSGLGTERASDSFGDGLLQHNRAYLDWLDGIFAKYPELVIENCGSGGMRMDYALLARHSIQSSSDQTDYRLNAVIAASCPTAVTPEQCAVWSYPLRDGSVEEAVFNMVNAMLMRIHQSGHLAEIGPERKRYVTEGIAAYKSYRQQLASAVPFWPLGLPAFGDGWLSLGMNGPDSCLVAVWRLEGPETVKALPVASLKGCRAEVRPVYPQDLPCRWQWMPETGVLSVELPERNTARLFELRLP